MGVAETMRALSKGCADVSTRRENECFAQRKRLVVGIHSSVVYVMCPRLRLSVVVGSDVGLHWPSTSRRARQSFAKPDACPRGPGSNWAICHSQSKNVRGFSISPSFEIRDGEPLQIHLFLSFANMCV